MSTQKLSDVVLDFKPRMHDRPVVSNSDKCKKRQKVFEAFAAQCMSQQRPGTLGLQRLDKDHGRSREYPIFEIAFRSGPVGWFVDCRQTFINWFERSSPRRGCSQKTDDLLYRLRTG